MFVTMNATEEFYDKLYKEKFEEYASEFKALNGDVSIYPCYNTLQVKDYSKFNMSSFSEEDKKKVHEDRFPIDLKNVYDFLCSSFICCSLLNLLLYFLIFYYLFQYFQLLCMVYQSK